jgi:hypothetical protein
VSDERIVSSIRLRFHEDIGRRIEEGRMHLTYKAETSSIPYGHFVSPHRFSLYAQAFFRTKLRITRIAIVDPLPIVIWKQFEFRRCHGYVKSASDKPCLDTRCISGCTFWTWWNFHIFKVMDLLGDSRVSLLHIPD